MRSTATSPCSVQIGVPATRQLHLGARRVSVSSETMITCFSETGPEPDCSLHQLHHSCGELPAGLPAVSFIAVEIRSLINSISSLEMSAADCIQSSMDFNLRLNRRKYASQAGEPAP